MWKLFRISFVRRILIYWRKYVFLFDIFLKHFGFFWKEFWFIERQNISIFDFQWNTFVSSSKEEIDIFERVSDLLQESLTWNFMKIYNDKIDNMATLWQLLWLNIIQSVHFGGYIHHCFCLPRMEIFQSKFTASNVKESCWIIYWR